ncbi:MAG: hypothetical protein ACTH0Y_02150 [Luteimonas sp.]
MKIILLIFGLLIHTSCPAAIPLGAEVFKRPGINNPMGIETANYNFSTRNSDDGYKIQGTHSNGNHISHTTKYGVINNVERIFVVESYFCDAESVDLVLQMGPLRHAETQRRMYYRIVFASDFSEVISEFYDPSVAAVNAVVPMQSAEGTPEPELGGEIVCDGSTPNVVYP